MSKVFVNDFEDDTFRLPEEKYPAEWDTIVPNQTWIMAVIIGYLILKNIEHVLDLSKWSKSDLLLMVAVGIWTYRYYILNGGV